MHIKHKGAMGSTASFQIIKSAGKDTGKFWESNPGIGFKPDGIIVLKGWNSGKTIKTDMEKKDWEHWGEFYV